MKTKHILKAIELVAPLTKPLDYLKSTADPSEKVLLRLYTELEKNLDKVGRNNEIDIFLEGSLLQIWWELKRPDSKCPSIHGAEDCDIKLKDLIDFEHWLMDIQIGIEKFPTKNNLNAKV